MSAWALVAMGALKCTFHRTPLENPQEGTVSAGVLCFVTFQNSHVAVPSYRCNKECTLSLVTLYCCCCMFARASFMLQMLQHARPTHVPAQAVAPVHRGHTMSLRGVENAM